MKTTLIAKLTSIYELAQTIDTGLWTGAYKSEETKTLALAAKDSLSAKYDRIRWVLKNRYGYIAQI